MKNINKYKKIISSLVLLCVILSIILIVSTYARYNTSASGNANVSVAKWNIKVNNQSIKSNSDLSSIITPVFDENSNIANGVIAPNSTGHFNVDLDFSDADVSCSYSIAISSLNSNVKDLIVTGYTLDGGTIQNVSNGSNAIIYGNFNYTDTVKTHSFVIYVKWNDDESTQYMNNYDDTQATISNIANATEKTNATTSMLVKTTFTQSNN
jgi:hypothetical protein